MPEPSYPKCKALYDYSATEPDELTFKEGDIIYIVKEGIYIIFFFFISINNIKSN